ncbi:MAG: hypothetical protein WC917_00490 [Bacilli bacterium]|jgi:hypothetical protein
MATLFEVTQFFDNNGIPLSAGHVYWYAAGTSTSKQTWKDAAETQPHVLAYIILDANGRFPGGACFIRGSYKLVVKNNDESTTYSTIDNISEYNSFDLTGLTASITDLNSTTTVTSSISGTYNITIADRGKTLLVNALSANATLNLPSAAMVGNTFKIWIKKIDVSTNTVTIIPFGSQTIDGYTNKVLYDYEDFIELKSDGSNWFIGGALIRGTMQYVFSNTTITLGDNGKIFNFNAGLGTFNFILPSCATVGRGFTVGFKKTDASLNQAILVPSGAQTIDGASNYFVHTQWQFTQIKTDGGNWYITEESKSATEFVTGNIKPSIGGAENGWILMNDGTIGNVGSGATTRANADCLALFSLVWNVNPAWCRIYTSAGALSSRGASAANDWAALKRLEIPKALGRSIISVGSAGLGNSYSIGQFFGEENHVLAHDENATHYHDPAGIFKEASTGIPQYAHLASNTNNFSGKGDGNFGWNPVGIADAHSISTENSGHSDGHNTVHPVLALNYLMKL